MEITKSNPPSDAMAQKIPQARLVKIEGGSHQLNLEYRQEFNTEVLKFLQNDLL